MTAATILPAARRNNAILFVASMGCAMTVLDTNIVGVVLPTIARGLGATFADIEWVISAYVLCFSSFLLPAGSLADRFGRKRIFLYGIALFALASLACGWAATASMLYAARALQGVGAAFLLAPALAIIGHTFHGKQERDRAWAVWGGVMGLTMVLSPLAGGVISTFFGWRWAFFINVPICGLLALAVSNVIDESKNPQAGPVDIHGIALFVAGMFSLTWALILGPDRGWESRDVILRIACGVWFFFCLVIVERRKSHPMLDLRLFSSWPFVGAVMAMFAYAASAQVMTSLLPLLLQNIEGKTALAAGIGMLPFAIAMLIFPQLTRFVSHVMSAKQLLSIGLLIVGFGNMVIAWALTHQHPLFITIGMALLGSGGGILNGETQKAIMGTIAPDRAGMGSGISTTARFSGILLGFASLGAILSSGVRNALHTQMVSAHVAMQPGFIDHIVSGDINRAMAMYPNSLAATLRTIAHQAYSSGFSQMLLTASLFAILAAVFVFMTLRGDRAKGGKNDQPKTSA